MHQTTIRFGSDTWAALELEAGALGVSAAQFVRDATLSRLASGGRHQQDPEELLPAPGTPQERVSESRALWAQAQHVRRRSEVLRAQAQEFRASVSADAGEG